MTAFTSHNIKWLFFIFFLYNSCFHLPDNSCFLSPDISPEKNCLYNRCFYYLYPDNCCLLISLTNCLLFFLNQRFSVSPENECILLSPRQQEITDVFLSFRKQRMDFVPAQTTAENHVTSENGYFSILTKRRLIFYFSSHKFQTLYLIFHFSPHNSCLFLPNNNWY